MASPKFLMTTGVAGVLACVNLTAQAETEGFADSFAGGKTALDWQGYAWFDSQPLEAVATEDAPDGDGGIGVLRHEGEGFSTVSYATTEKAEDSFRVEAWIDCPYEAAGRDGTLTGLVFYLQTEPAAANPEEQGGFYRLVCDYRFGSGSFSLAYLGPNTGRQPLELERWPLIEQPADRGQDGWRRLAVQVDQGLIDIFLDDAKLNERPIAAERVVSDIAGVDAGYAGVYSGSLSQEGTAEARVDGFLYQPDWSESMR